MSNAMEYIACQHDWPEMLELIRGKERIVACDGYVIHDGSRKVDERAIFGAWGVDVAKGVARGLPVPAKVKADYEERVTRRKAGELGVHLNPPVLLNAKGKPFSWSFSAINDFDTCPAQYAAKRYYETIKFEDTTATIWGTQVHQAMENRVKLGAPLPAGMGQWDPYCQAFIAKRARGWKVETELQIAIDRVMALTSWFDKTTWGRGAVDVLALSPDKTECLTIDWKTGKKKEDQFQLDVFCALISLIHPEIQIYKPRFIWLKTGEVSGQDRTAADIPRIWQEIIKRTNRMEEAWRTQNFVARSSGLCRGWCPVTECKHCVVK